MKLRGLLAASLALAGLAPIASVRADMVTDWNLNLFEAVRVAGDFPQVETRALAIVQVAVFDAVNGIHRKYEPYFVTERAPHGARADAAAAQAAYVTLKAMYPDQAATFDAELAASLASLAGGEDHDGSISRGLAWGEHVAGLILALRAQDGSTASYPPYFGGTAPGVWRSLPTPTNPDGTLPAILPQWPHVVPFALVSGSQFRPGPPPALSSLEYAMNVNEVKALGRVDSTVRTAEQTQVSLFWGNYIDFSDELLLASSVLPPEASLVDKARALALVSMAGGDAAIAVFDAKYTYNLWRPYHAIRLAATAGNPLVVPDPTWTALLGTPRHQEYPSNHSCVTGAMMRVLSRLLGDEHTFTLSSPDLPGFGITFQRFSDAAAQVQQSRVWGGIHYPNSCQVGGTLGVTVADYVVDNFLRPLEDGDEEAHE